MKERITFEAYIDNLMSGEFTKIEKDGKRTFSNIDNEMNGLNNRMVNIGTSAKKLMGMLGGAVAGFFVLDKFRELGNNIVETTSKYQNFAAILTNTLGSRGEAQKAFSEIESFAARTPFQVDEITDAFVKLTNQGFRPSMDQMTALGDIAASKGKSFDQLAEALIDAEVGEFERLKEFGIRARADGDKVTFTFKGVKTTIDNTSESIQNYIINLGKATGVGGAMAKMSATTGGKISNLKDSMDKLNASLGERFKDVIDDATEGAGKFVSLLTDWVKVPVADKLREEQGEVNALVHALYNTETPQNLRLEYYNRLKDLAPDILEGITQEDIATGKLADKYDLLAENLKKYNTQRIQQISYESNKEELDKILNVEGEYEGLILKKMIRLYKEYDAAMRAIDKTTITDPAVKMVYDKTMALLDSREDPLKILETVFTKGGYARVEGVTAHEYDKLAKTYNESKKYTAEHKEEKDVLIEAMAKSQASLLVTSGGSTTPTAPPIIPGGPQSPSEKALADISGDNRQVKNITINIDRLGGMENVRISKESEQEDLNKILDNLRRALLTVVNDVNLIAN